MPHGSNLPILCFAENSILRDVLLSDHGVTVKLECVRVQLVEQNERIREIHDETGSAVGILEASLDLKKMPHLGFLED
jgi:hypothetical protein